MKSVDYVLSPMESKERGLYLERRQYMGKKKKKKGQDVASASCTVLTSCERAEGMPKDIYGVGAGETL